MALLTLLPLSTGCDTGPGHTGQPGPPSCHTALTSHISLLRVLSLCDNIDNNARCHVSLTPDMDTGDCTNPSVAPPGLYQLGFSMMGGSSTGFWVKENKKVGETVSGTERM